MSKIKKIVFGVPMSYGHTGLIEFLREHARIDVEGLPSGELIAVVNRQGDKAKIIGASGTILGYLKLPSGKIRRDDLESISRVFGGHGFNYTAGATLAMRMRFRQETTKKTA